ncbi:hypothetical protein C8F04DRAFT_1032076 [Mycena alexandri]|uniref:UBR-type domain-containing protein n=1 Tax=Mycena alexandri TaxID=1745969 RepID=A0AAD6T7M5_9AGAR|nr:hypothetical protein C8F04DRAFT_1032076 [Mycena alexandri]
MSESLQAYVASQDELVKEAGLALPHQFSQCSYALGHVRQAVYLCLTCPEARGLCSACSIACHTDHNQIELFPKRNFRCDCPTAAIAHACTLHTDSVEPVNASNQYGQNFQAKFCRCGRGYDAKTEREAMIQCVSCEDWFHESCCMLRTRPEPRPPTPEPEEVNPLPPPQTDPATITTTSSPENQSASSANANIADDANDDDAASIASSSGLPPPLISADDYDAFVCRVCVRAIPTLGRIVGTTGAITVVRADASAPWMRVGDVPQEDANVAIADDAEAAGKQGEVDEGVGVGGKRPSAPHAADEEPATKRARIEGSSSASSSKCLAPPPEPLYTDADAEWDPETALCTGDVFLTEGWRGRWCRCDNCLPSLEAHPYLLEEEETYEPPEDPDSGLSLEELGMRALERLPRDRAIDGILAFNAMRDSLTAYLRPFAEEGKVVAEADVQTFFEQLNRARGEAA